MVTNAESIFDETVQHINAKSLSLEECEKLIADMTHEMDRLQSDLSSLKVFPFVLYANIRCFEHMNFPIEIICVVTSLFPLRKNIS